MAVLLKLKITFYFLWLRGANFIMLFKILRFKFYKYDNTLTCNGFTEKIVITLSDLKQCINGKHFISV